MKTSSLISFSFRLNGFILQLVEEFPLRDHTQFSTSIATTRIPVPAITHEADAEDQRATSYGYRFNHDWSYLQKYVTRNCMSELVRRPNCRRINCTSAAHYRTSTARDGKQASKQAVPAASGNLPSGHLSRSPKHS
jgi:hypothetical protein